VGPQFPWGSNSEGLPECTAEVRAEQPYQERLPFLRSFVHEVTRNLNLVQGVHKNATPAGRALPFPLRSPDWRPRTRGVGCGLFPNETQLITKLVPEQGVLALKRRNGIWTQAA